MKSKMPKLFELGELIKYFDKQNLANYRWDQFLQYYFSKEITAVPNWDDFTTWGKKLKADFAENFLLNNIDSFEIQSAKNNRSHKALLKLDDGQLVETVLMSYKEYKTVCLSSQIGCPLNCQFCATGAGGFARNLSEIEILEQYQFWLSQLNKREIASPKPAIKNLVFMGMGEPFLNWQAVKDSIYLFNQHYNIGMRHMTVSTSGLIKGIREFAQENWEVNLAISLHAGFNKTRNLLMPINVANPLNKLWEAINYYFRNNNRKVFLEYILIDGINDSLEEIKAVIDQMKKSTPKLLHLNLIPYNEVEGKPWERSRPEQIKKIQYLLTKENIHFTLRKSLGSDVEGACGQLKHKSVKKK